MTDAIETIYIAEGIPAGTPSLTAIRALRLRRERRREQTIGLSLAVANLVLGGFSQEGSSDPMRAFRHLFTDEEYDKMIQDRADAEQIEAQRKQIEKLERMFG